MHLISKGTALEFLQNEFVELDFRNKRLKKRFYNTLELMSKKLTSCVRRLTTCTNEMRQIYDFLKNPKVHHDKVLSAHFKKTAQRLDGYQGDYILAIQDGMRLNFTNHVAKIDIGRICEANGKEQYGIIQHSTLCVTPDNEPLGLIDIQYYDYDQFDKSINRSLRKIEDKASYCWIKSIKNLLRLVNDSRKLVIVADREADIFEALSFLKQHSLNCVIRSNGKRKIGEQTKASNPPLDHVLNEVNDKGAMTIEIQNVASRTIESLDLKLKASKVSIPAPQKLISLHGKDKYPPVEMNVVKAYNETHEWILYNHLAY